MGAFSIGCGMVMVVVQRMGGRRWVVLGSVLPRTGGGMIAPRGGAGGGISKVYHALGRSQKTSPKVGWYLGRKLREPGFLGVWQLSVLVLNLARLPNSATWAIGVFGLNTRFIKGLG